MEKKNVLYISQEITPYLPETYMSKLTRSLSQGIQERGKEIRTFMPKYGCINERRNQLHEVIRLSGMNLIIDDTDHPLIIKVASIQAARMQVYFIDNEEFFQRKAVLKDEAGKYFEDNDERAIFFARGVLETVKQLRWSPDIIHCHGWITSLIPLYVKEVFKDNPLLNNSKIVYSVYDDDFEPSLSNDFYKKLKDEGFKDKSIELLKDDPSFTNLMKTTVKESDAVIQASPEINKEVSDFTSANSKSFLGYQEPENFIDKYNEFYDQLLG